MATRVRDPGSRAPLWLRLLLPSLLVLGIFGMHDLVVDHMYVPASHHSVAGMAAEAASLPGDAFHSIIGDQAPLNATMPSGAMTGPMAECCGFMLLCIAILLGASASLLLRRQNNARVLWQRPPPAAMMAVLRLPPIGGLSRLEVSSILRC